MLRSLYVIAIGLLFAGVVGMGVNAFYETPEYPACDIEKLPRAIDSNETPAPNSDCKNKLDIYNEEKDAIDINKSLIYIGISIIVIVVSILGLGKVEVIGDGMTMGGIFILFIGLMQSFSTENEIYKFSATLAALVIVIFLSYWKFIRGHNMPSKD